MMAGVDASATKLRAVAHDGFAAMIPLTDLAVYGPLVAHAKDGQRITDTKHGPLSSLTRVTSIPSCRPSGRR